MFVFVKSVAAPVPLALAFV